MKTTKRAIAVPFRTLAHHKMLASQKRKAEAAARALTEGSGTAGGYTVPDEEQRETKGELPQDEDARRIAGEAAGVMNRHAEDGAQDGHVLHLHEESKDLHHQHPEGEAPERLEAIKSDLENIEGAGKVTQGTEPPPPEAGFTHQLKKPEPETETRGMEGAEEEEETPTSKSKKHDCACKNKNRGGRRRKDLADGDPAGAGAGADAGTDDLEVEGDDADGQPHGAGLAAHVIEYLEGEIPQLEPECRDYFQEKLDEMRAWAAERYPDLEFGGSAAGATGGEGATADDQATEDALERYQGNKRLQKALDEHPQAQHFREVVDGAAGHLHEMASMPEKSFGQRHQKKCLMHARSLDKVHGMLLKDAGEETVEKPGGTPPTPPRPGTEEGDREGSEGELDTKAILGAVRALESKVDAGAQRIDRELYKVTGKR
jgi:hypothetical protein